MSDGGSTSEEGSGAELVEVAYVGGEPEALMIQALLEGAGIPSLLQQVTPSGMLIGVGAMNPGGGSRRVMVHAHRAEEARALLAEGRAEGESEVPEPANAEYLADARGRRPRSYGVVGGYARIYFWSFATMALAFGVFMIARTL